jgi:hypothetical protein
VELGGIRAATCRRGDTDEEKLKRRSSVAKESRAGRVTPGSGLVWPARLHVPKLGSRMDAAAADVIQDGTGEEMMRRG